MATSSIIFGFGGCEFTDGTTTATFSGGSGIISFSPVYIRKENINYDIISRLLGYRVTINITELYNVDTTDYEEMQNLLQILASLISEDSQETLTVTPRDDTTLDNNIDYECILTSPITLNDVHRTKIGQRLDLKFTATALADTIPYQTVSGSTENVYWDGTDEYEDDSSNTYTDGLG